MKAFVHKVKYWGVESVKVNILAFTVFVLISAETSILIYLFWLYIISLSPLHR